MPKPVPTPLAAALGLVPTVLGGVRRLPGRVVQLPVLAVSSALTTLDAYRRGYDDLAARGERLLASLRGTSVDAVEDRVEDALQGTPLARPYEAAEDALEGAGERAGRALRAVGSGADSAAAAVAAPVKAATKAPTRAVAKAAEKAAERAGSLSDDLASAADAAKETVKETVGESAPSTPAAEQPKGAPTPKATQPDDTRIDTAATSDVVQTVEQVAARTGGTVLEHDELPLPDYDHMTLGSLRGRLRSLSVEQLVQVRDYEKAHANRLPVVTMLDNRIAKLSTDPTAEPTGKTDAPVPELQPSQVGRGGSKVQPATGGPKQNPTSQGDPTNPGQPRGSGSGSTNPSNPNG